MDIRTPPTGTRYAQALRITSWRTAAPSPVDCPYNARGLPLCPPKLRVGRPRIAVPSERPLPVGCPCPCPYLAYCPWVPLPAGLSPDFTGSALCPFCSLCTRAQISTYWVSESMDVRIPQYPEILISLYREITPFVGGQFTDNGHRTGTGNHAHGSSTPSAGTGHLRALYGYGPSVGTGNLRATVDMRRPDNLRTTGT